MRPGHLNRWPLTLCPLGLQVSGTAGRQVDISSSPTWPCSPKCRLWDVCCALWERKPPVQMKWPQELYILQMEAQHPLL